MCWKSQKVRKYTCRPCINSISTSPQKKSQTYKKLLFVDVLSIGLIKDEADKEPYYHTKIALWRVKNVPKDHLSLLYFCDLWWGQFKVQIFSSLVVANNLEIPHFGWTHSLICQKSLSCISFYCPFEFFYFYFYCNSQICTNWTLLEFDRFA